MGIGNPFEDVAPRFHEVGIIPVISLDDAKDSEALADALYEGGLPAAEVTFRTASGPEALRRMRRRHPDMLVGAGTVLSQAQADIAASAGAAFIVSPGLNPAVVSHCIDHSLPVCPGIATASEIERAMALGLTHVKFFPAEPMGGLAAIKALSAPYREMSFMPTGGINPENASAYLSHERIFAVGGSWMVPHALLASRDFDAIGRLAAEAAHIVQACRS